MTDTLYLLNGEGGRRSRLCRSLFPKELVTIADEEIEASKPSEIAEKALVGRVTDGGDSEHWKMGCVSGWRGLPSKQLKIISRCRHGLHPVRGIWRVTV